MKELPARPGNRDYEPRLQNALDLLGQDKASGLRMGQQLLSSRIAETSYGSEPSQPCRQPFDLVSNSAHGS